MKIENKIGNRKDFDLILSNDTKRCFVSFVNPFSYMIICKNHVVIHDIDTFFIDGNSLRILHGLFYDKVERISFDYSSIASDVFHYAANNNINIGLIGATNTEMKKALQNIKLNHKNLNVVYSRNGYFSSKYDKRKTLNDINDSNVELLIVGMGTPYQEEFMSLVKSSCPKVRLAFSCGGFLTQTSISRDYYLPFIKKFNLMWLQRMVMHRHIRSRVLIDYPVFAIKYIFNNIKRICL